MPFFPERWELSFPAGWVSERCLLWMPMRGGREHVATHSHCLPTSGERAGQGCYREAKKLYLLLLSQGCFSHEGQQLMLPIPGEGQWGKVADSTSISSLEVMQSQRGGGREKNPLFFRTGLLSLLTLWITQLSHFIQLVRSPRGFSSKSLLCPPDTLGQTTFCCQWGRGTALSWESKGRLDTVDWKGRIKLLVFQHIKLDDICEKLLFLQATRADGNTSLIELAHMHWLHTGYLC